MIKGGGSLGSHKHGVSGHAGHSPRFRHQTELELRREEKFKAKKKPGLRAQTVAEAMQYARPR
jgi:hypothetical protein